MTKSVCIVGAGPSGLAAAKSLLHDVEPGSFRVTIFEAQNRIGGLWPTRRDDGHGLVHPLMVANQSRHTMQFSDHAWHDSIPEIPQAWQVGQYLDTYSKTYHGADIQLGHKVVRTELQGDGSWEVHVSHDNTSKQSVFDYLLVTTGFFGQPIWPENIPKEGTAVPIVHSSKYRDLEGLLGQSKARDEGGKILIVGGQMSGIEIAGTIATHLSSAINSPGEKVIPNPEKYSIHHVSNKKSWVFPLHTSPDPSTPAPPFLPCDMPSYNLENRPKPLTNTQGHISVETARMVNSIFKNSLGTNQSEFSPKVKIDGDDFDEQPYLAMSTNYLDFVREGLITISNGKLESLQESTAKLSPTQEEITDIAAVVLATGFDASPSLSFLPPSVLDTISYSPSHINHPAALAFHGTHHPSLPTLGFVGFYRSPYWGVMEMQSRLISTLWTTPVSSRPESLTNALSLDDSISRTLALRSDPRCSQFPMGDYSYLMQEFSTALSIPITPPNPVPVPSSSDNGEEGKPQKVIDLLTPSRYPHPRAASQPHQLAANKANLTHTYSVLYAGLTTPRFVSSAVFRSLLGTWSLERDLTSRHPALPSGHFSGTAKFLLRHGTPDGRSSSSSSSSSSSHGLEYLYVEEGDFSASNGLTFRATRRYVWRFDDDGKEGEKISVWFVRTDDSQRADYLFHDIEFLNRSDNDAAIGGIWGKEEKGWKARSSHLCIEDLYSVQYAFRFANGVNLKDWRIGYTVKGPKKDYSIDGVYQRL